MNRCKKSVLSEQITPISIPPDLYTIRSNSLLKFLDKYLEWFFHYFVLFPQIINQLGISQFSQFSYLHSSFLSQLLQLLRFQWLFYLFQCLDIKNNTLERFANYIKSYPIIIICYNNYFIIIENVLLVWCFQEVWKGSIDLKRVEKQMQQPSQLLLSQNRCIFLILHYFHCVFVNAD